MSGPARTPWSPRLAVALRRLAWTLGLLLAALIGAGNWWVVASTQDALYNNWAELPDHEVGLVLGTSPFTGSGDRNPHFGGRIAAAAELYQLGKVKHLILSGANPDQHYNEPEKMQQALVDLGVPLQAMTLDGGGSRTFDSIQRAHRVFGLTRFIIITQDYHAYRALFLARKMGMQPVAYAPVGEESGPAFRPYLREVLARTWAIADVFLFDTEAASTAEPEGAPVPVPARQNPTEGRPTSGEP